RLEHHANYLPWQRLCLEAGASLKTIELDEQGQLLLPADDELFHPRVKLIALSMVSNVLGTMAPIQAISEKARARDISVMVDGAQAVAHNKVNVETLGCDFFAFSAHKMYGPNGIGGLYARQDRLEAMEPLLVGGGMVDHVSPNGSTWSPSPAKFEAGSPNLADAVGLAAAADYLESIGMDTVHQHLQALTQTALQKLDSMPGIRIYGATDAALRAGIIAFDIEGVHPHDTAQIAGEHNVAIRAGHHCCQPLMQSLGIAATSRASFGIYNDEIDIDALIEAVKAAQEFFG
ncbi:MAG: aminotransferase class V-fold PLP-dependent enzyme, partial [Pseudomonadota bacterium]